MVGQVHRARPIDELEERQVVESPDLGQRQAFGSIPWGVFLAYFAPPACLNRTRSGDRPLNQVLFLCSGNYYRSRYAEIVFNALAQRSGLDWIASSAGLLPEHFNVNPGPISLTTLATAQDRGFAVPEPTRPPER